jgi:hypothetical protein
LRQHATDKTSTEQPMNRIIRDADGNEWKLVPTGSTRGTASNTETSSEAGYDVYELRLADGRDAGARFVSIPKAWNLDDPTVQRTILARGASEVG